MAERGQDTLLFGAGLDRDSGVLRAEPPAANYLENVVIRGGSARARKGIVAAGGFTADNILGLAAFRAIGGGLVVSDLGGIVKLHRVSGQGTNAEYLADWYGHPPTSRFPQVPTFAESAGRMFVAMDEPGIGARPTTQVYTPGSGVAPLEANLGGGLAGVKFRGVASWGPYIIGWGYGNADEPDRPDIARISKPSDPTAFLPNSLFYAGQKGSSIVAGASAGDRFLLFKQHEFYRIEGTSFRDFGIVPVDKQFGCAGARLAVTVGSLCYFWSLEGPRVTDGGPSRDLSYGLALHERELLSLPQEGEAYAGWAEYLPEERCILFAFPAGSATTVYCLSLDAGTERPAWSYWNVPWTLGGAAVFVGSESIVGPVSAPIIAPVTGVEAFAGHFRAVAAWTEAGTLLGDETFEYWLKTGSGPWGLVSRYISSTPGSYRQFFMTGLIEQTNYVAACRYTRSGLASPGSESSNPSDWPAAQQTTFSTPERFIPQPDMGAVSNLAAFSAVANWAEAVDVIPGSVVEFWMNAPGRGWFLQYVTPAGTPSQPRNHGVDLTELTVYSFAIRYVFNGIASTAARSANPFDWPGTVTFNTPERQIPAPTPLPADQVTASSARVGWVEAVDVLAGSVVELWLRAGFGAWVKRGEFPAGPPSSGKQLTLGNLAANATYTLAVRYRWEGRFSSGARGADPGTWDAPRKTTFQTKSANAPGGGGGGGGGDTQPQPL